MTSLLELQADARVLELGTGSGYQTAVLAEMAAHVYSIEIVPGLARRAAQVLARLGYSNVSLRTGDGSRGWPEEAPFEAILLTAAPEQVPAALTAQLARGGRLVAPVGARRGNQMLRLITCRPDGVLRQQSLGGVRFVPLVGDEGTEQTEQAG
jgi:protein-L-isoaspartate(D-aspartate) O-methyltransferase